MFFQPLLYKTIVCLTFNTIWLTWPSVQGFLLNKINSANKGNVLKAYRDGRETNERGVILSTKGQNTRFDPFQDAIDVEG